MRPLFNENNLSRRAFLGCYAPHLVTEPGWEELPSHRDFLNWIYDRFPDIVKVYVTALTERADANDPERAHNKREQFLRDNIVFKPHIRESVVEAGMTMETLLERPEYPGVASAKQAVRHWCEGYGKAILLLGGHPGVGKTHLASAAVHLLKSRQQEVLYLTDAQMVSELHAAIGRNEHDVALADIVGVQRLVWDDLGMAARGQYDQSELDNVVNERWGGAGDGGQRTLITTNLSASDLPPRIASRLADVGRVAVVDIRAGDYRREQRGTGRTG